MTNKLQTPNALARAKTSKYTNLGFTQSKGKKFNFGSIAKRNRPVSLAKVNLKGVEE